MRRIDRSSWYYGTPTSVGIGFGWHPFTHELCQDVTVVLHIEPKEALFRAIDAAMAAHRCVDYGYHL